MEMPSMNVAKARIWRERVVTQQASGKRVRAWCRENACHEHSFHWWRARLGLSPVARKGVAAATPVGFARVAVKSGEAGAGMNPADPIRVSLIGGREVILPVSMPVERIALLIRAIEGVV
jgi:hypothetical protein